MRQSLGVDVEASCSLLGVAVEGVPVVLPARFPSQTLEVDLLLRVGRRRLVHVEYEKWPDADLVRRMLQYRALIMERYPGCAITQYVIVLGEGQVTGYDDLAGNGFALDLKVVYLRDVAPGAFLAHPGLAPLAVLGRGSPRQRAAAFGQALRIIQAQGGSAGVDRTDVLLECATVLATIRLAPHTIDVTAKGAGMAVESLARIFRNNDFGQLLLHEGREQGREQGLEQGRVELLVAVLRARFGDHPDLSASAHRLAAWPDADVAVRAVLSAATLDDLPAEPPDPATA